LPGAEEKEAAMILVIDNYDSFTYNLVQHFGQLHGDIEVRRNDELTAEQAMGLHPDYLVLSPGPGNPDQAGICLELIELAAGKIPLLGVCLGHQSIAQAFGGKIIRAEEIIHGKTSPIFHQQSPLFRGLPDPFLATRYHSLCVDPGSLPGELRVTARTSDDVIMAIEHVDLAIQGVQFHPESVLTEVGLPMLKNFLEMYPEASS
jgi:anthranilate synthase/aminodeoxychorismate synthase-like glutamine amidotransferase